MEPNREFLGRRSKTTQPKEAAVRSYHRYKHMAMTGRHPGADGQFTDAQRQTSPDNAHQPQGYPGSGPIKENAELLYRSISLKVHQKNQTGTPAKWHQQTTISRALIDTANTDQINNAEALESKAR